MFSGPWSLKIVTRINYFSWRQELQFLCWQYRAKGVTEQTWFLIQVLPVAKWEAQKVTFCTLSSIIFKITAKCARRTAGIHSIHIYSVNELSGRLNEITYLFTWQGCSGVHFPALYLWQFNPRMSPLTWQEGLHVVMILQE